MFKWAAVVILGAAILAAAALIVGEMRYRDCIHTRDALYRAAGSGSLFTGQPGPRTLSYAGCSHSPL